MPDILPLVLAVAIGAIAALAVTALVSWARAKRRRTQHVISPVFTDSALATARAFGGLALVVTPSHLVVYSSDAARVVPLVTRGRLAHPALVALAEETWRSTSPVSRTLSFTDLGPIEEAELRGSRVDERFILLVIVDRTEQVRTERIRRDFVANIGHELRTPIAAVELIAETLLAACDNPDTVRHFSERLGEEGHRLARLTEDVMALAAIQDELPAGQLRPVTASEIVAEAVAAQYVVADGKGIDIVISKSVDAEVLGDAQSLMVALENLIANAVNYSASGSQVSVATSIDTQADELHIAVIDTGIGIPADELDRIFERFYRVDASRSHRSGGTGLGLAIVKHTALSHGGSVSVWSRLGQGSTFTLRLPLYHGDDGATTESSSGSASIELKPATMIESVVNESGGDSANDSVVELTDGVSGVDSVDGSANKLAFESAPPTPTDSLITGDDL